MFRIGVLGSAFNPPTRGHVDVLQQAASQFDRILLVPSARHPFGKQSLPFEARVTMLQLLARDLDVPCDIEICTLEADLAAHRTDPVYTFDLLCALEEQLAVQYSDFKLTFIVGPDNADPEIWQNFYRANDITERWPLFTAQQNLNIRSTQVRDLLLQAPDDLDSVLRQLVPEVIADYLQSQNLYQKSPLIPPPQFTSHDVEITKQENCFTGFFQVDRYSLKHRLFAGGWSDELHREVFVRTKAVAVLPVDLRNQKVVLVEQFRVGALAANQSPWLLEIVAGILEEGEQPEELAHRETMEEAGLRIDRLLPICEYFPSPGGSSEQLEIFCGVVDTSEAGGLYGLPHEGEDIRVHSISIADAFDLLNGGKLNNAATIIALQWLKLNLSKLR